MIVVCRFPLLATLIVTLALYFNGNEITTYFIRNQKYDKSRTSMLSVERFHDMS